MVDSPKSSPCSDPSVGSCESRQSCVGNASTCNDHRCEYECKNNGTCTIGLQHRDEFFYWQYGSSSNQDEYFCSCPMGFVGPQCEFKYDVCGTTTGEQVCIHGSSCVAAASDTETDSYVCECLENVMNVNDTINDQTDTSCQSHRTEFCIPTDGHLEYSGGMAVSAFCVNDGKCVDVVIEGGEVHFSCFCPTGYTGPHCEFLSLESESSKTAVQNNDNNVPSHMAPWVGLVVVGATILLVGIAFALRQAKRLIAKKKEGDTFNLQGFRDEDGDVAFSPNGGMLFPDFGMQDSLNTARSRSRKHQTGWFG